VDIAQLAIRLMSENLIAANESFEQDPDLISAHGLPPDILHAQNSLPSAIDAERRLLDAILLSESRLTRLQKFAILRCVSEIAGNEHGPDLHVQIKSGQGGDDPALLGFVAKLARHAPWVSANDVAALRACGVDDELILEVVATTALGQMFCTLANGLFPSDVSRAFPALPNPGDVGETAGPYLGPRPRPAAEKSQSYSFLKEEYGFIPNLYLVQGLRPDFVEAETYALERIMRHENVLSRIQKEYILLAVSAANLNTYCVSLGGQIISILGGASLEECDQIVEDHHQSQISPADKALLDEARKLAVLSQQLGCSFEGEQLRAYGFTQPQIIEAVVVSSLANFLNTLQAGLGAVPDFPPRRVLSPKDLYPSAGKSRPTYDAAVSEDPDAAVVRRVQAGDVEAFEELVRRHSRGVFGTLAGLIGNMDDVRDVTQDVFLKAFEHIGSFQGRSKFSTWLTSIAVNTGRQLLRDRKPLEPLEEEDDEGFRPRQIQSWAENPEQLLAASQRDELVRMAVLRLPEKYRVVVLLRDIQQLSTEEAASALDLSIPAVKARLLRGRLMLRESLAQHFIRTGNQES
jgi:RNA polymerase sigma-70 factor, ECF subfamily